MNKFYSQEEALKETTKYFNGDSLAADVWVKKYALRNESGELLEKTPDDMHRRLAKEFARIEAKYPNPMSEDEIYNLLKKTGTNDLGMGYIVPQGSPMSAIGNPYKMQSLSNCFVINSPSDSYGGILFADQEQAQIMKRRGGVGFDISTIRPRGLSTANAAGTTDGIAVFMERFSNTCREVAQGGRRGALMISISVSHYEIETFINIKKDLKKVTGANISIRLSDEFMNAVKNDTDFTLQWPVEVPLEQAKITKTVKAKDIWNQIIDAAWTSAEPGLLFWDTAKKNTPSDAYDSKGYGSQSTNPCLTADTLIAVADGRGFVSIGDLANEGKDIPVYACDDSGKIIIKTMRNPRLTGKNMPVYKVTIEGGHSFKATANHTMIMRDGSRKSVQDLQQGDQLQIAKRTERTLVELNKNIRTNNKNHYVVLENHVRSKSEHKMIWEFINGSVPKGHVIHHIDFNSKNNNIENLLCMEFEAHKELHAKNMMGENNPAYKIKENPEKYAEYIQKLSEASSGLNNARAFNVTNEEIFEHIKILTKQIGRRVNINDWTAYAEKNSLPRYLNSFRLNEKNFSDIAKECQISDDLIDMDSRMARRALEAEESGYSWKRVDNELHVEKTCEWCSKKFWAEYVKREISFCGPSCSNLYANRKEGKNIVRTASLQKMHKDRADVTRIGQLNAFTKLRFELGRDPIFVEWVKECKANGLPSRIGTKNGFATWPQLKSEAALHNHRVISVEFAGNEDVYNGTVDDVHNFYIGGWNNENNESLLILNQNCGEIILSPYDSCRLIVMDLSKFVNDPFSENAKFDYVKFNEYSIKAQRLMDDLVDLEIEAVDKIIQKIEADPEPEEVKTIELNLWKKIREIGNNGRRTGLGVTALGDTLAMLGIKYGSDESVVKVESIYSALSLAAYRSSVNMAKERGVFSAYDYELEKDHPFINQVMNLDDQLRSDWEKYGRRNIALTTTSPAGSVSTLTQTTSGIEPVFMTSYKRRRKLNINDNETKVDFVDQLGDKWQEYNVYHHYYRKWLDSQGILGDPTNEQILKSPYYGATANDIDWVKSIDLMAGAQKWICHSLSKTVNLPNSVTKDEVAQVYMRGWESGCKGVTVYRDGCRTGVLVSTDEKKESNGEFKFEQRSAPKRPETLNCDIHRGTVRSGDVTESYIVFVGLLDGKPYEIFCGPSGNIDVPKKAKHGSITKKARKDGNSRYDLTIPVGDDDSLNLRDIVHLFDSPNDGALTRTISLALRHGAPVQYIVEQLQKDKNSDMWSFNRVVARVLKNYIPDGSKSSDKKCYDCGAEDALVYKEGCVTCIQCGASKCG